MKQAFKGFVLPASCELGLEFGPGLWPWVKGDSYSAPMPSSQEHRPVLLLTASAEPSLPRAPVPEQHQHPRSTPARLDLASAGYLFGMPGRTPPRFGQTGVCDGDDQEPPASAGEPVVGATGFIRASSVRRLRIRSMRSRSGTACQRRIVASSLPLASTEPSGLKATSPDPSVVVPTQRFADRLPGRDVPEADRRVHASRSPAPNRPGLKATRRQVGRHAHAAARRSIARPRRPRGGSSITTPARQHRTVRAERDPQDSAVVPVQRLADRLPGRDVPEADRRVLRPARQHRTVRAEGDGERQVR